MGLQFVAEDEPDLTLPEDTIIRAQLTELKPRTIEWTSKQDGSKKSATFLEWWWQVQSPEQYATRKVKGECEAKLTNHPGNKFRNWSETLLGREIPVGMGIDTDDLVGLTADITVRHEKDKKDASKVWERVDEVIGVTNFSVSDQPPF